MNIFDTNNNIELNDLIPGCLYQTPGLRPRSIENDVCFDIDKQDTIILFLGYRKGIFTDKFIRLNFFDLKTCKLYSAAMFEVQNFLRFFKKLGMC